MVKSWLYLSTAFSMLVSLSDFVSCQNNTYANNYDYSGALGVGYGVIATVIAVFIGVFICIYGWATTEPACFNFIGLAIPVVVFLFVILTPSEASEITKPEENPARNPFVPIKWFLFAFVLIYLILVCVPLFNLWALALIPQRVDSRAQKEFYEKQEKMKELEKIEHERQIAEKMKKDNEEAQLLIARENLPENNAPRDGAPIGPGEQYDNDRNAINVNNDGDNELGNINDYNPSENFSNPQPPQQGLNNQQYTQSMQFSQQPNPNLQLNQQSNLQSNPQPINPNPVYPVSDSYNRGSIEMQQRGSVMPQEETTNSRLQKLKRRIPGSNANAGNQ